MFVFRLQFALLYLVKISAAVGRACLPTSLSETVERTRQYEIIEKYTRKCSSEHSSVTQSHQADVLGSC